MLCIEHMYISRLSVYILLYTSLYIYIAAHKFSFSYLFLSCKTKNQLLSNICFVHIYVTLYFRISRCVGYVFQNVYV